MTNAVIINLIFVISSGMNFDPHLALAVAQTESSLNPSAVGPVGEIGLFQIRPEYSDLSEDELKVVENNIREGIRKLKEAADQCKHNEEFEWVVCYNLGVTGGSRIKYPRLFPYYLKVTENYRKLKVERNIASTKE